MNLTDLGTIRALCGKYDFSLSKDYGQNFLINPSVCPRLCETAGLTSQSNVLEIGPGFGTLTRELASRAGKVVSVEVDKRLLPVLAETLQDYSNTKIVNADVLQCDLGALIQNEFGSGPVTVCANLPYYITSPVLMKLLESDLPLDNITVMVQKEAAVRIAAQPGTREAGAISYAVHYRAQAKMAFTVKPGSFYPPPKVTSSVIRLDVLPKPALADSPEREKRLFHLIRAGFGQRRKTLVNAVAAGLGLPKQIILEALEASGKKATIRAEQMNLEDYMRLEKELWP